MTSGLSDEWSVAELLHHLFDFIQGMTPDLAAVHFRAALGSRAIRGAASKTAPPELMDEEKMCFKSVSREMCLVRVLTFCSLDYEFHELHLQFKGFSQMI